MTLNLEQVYADAEARRKVIAEEIGLAETDITERKATITALKSEDADLERLLRSREPRIRTPKQKVPKQPKAQAEPAVQTDAEGEPV